MLVKGEGNPNARIHIYGEAPGAQEEASGRPFVGGSGRVLDGILHEAGIKRDETFIDNVIQRRPPRNDFGVYYEDRQRRKPKKELLENHERIRNLIRTHKPNVVAALGNEALFALTGRKAVTKWRGSILGCGGTKVIPTIHPAMVMRQYEFRPITVLDFTRIREESLSPEFPLPYLDRFITSPSFEKIMDTIKSLHSKEYLAFDIETAKNQIVCIGFGWSNTESICIPIFYGNGSWWSPREELAIATEIRKLFANPYPKFIAQNAQFDMVYLADKWGVKVANLWMDTMVAFHCVYPELRKGLDFLCSIYTKRPYYKSMSREQSGPDVLWKYNCLDTVVTLECAMAIRKELDEFGTSEFYFKHSHKLITPLIRMQRRGVRIDVIKRSEIDARLDKEIEEMQLRLNAVVGHELNPNSPKQMKEFLYNELKLPPQRNRATGNLTANEEAIEELAKRYKNPVFELVLDIRKARKLLSTYIRAPLDDDERIRCSYVITGTETGRLSSRESVYGSGTNLQNIPRGKIVRSIFIPDKGRRFINADLSQAEARVVAYLSNETRLQTLFEEANGDVHKTNAAMVFNKRVDDITQRERQLAKTLVHAANYGIGARTFSKHIGESESHARELLNQYYAMYPSIKLWHREIESSLRKSRILSTPLGRKRMFFGRWGPDLVREGLAYIPQSTVSDILNYGIIRAWPNLPPEWEIMMQVHDSILMQVPIEAANMHIHKFIKHYFENPIEIGRKTFKIPVDIKTGDSWGNLKPMEV